MPRTMRMKRKYALTELSERIGRIERLLLPSEELSSEELHWLDGLRVQCIKDGAVGTVIHIFLNRNGQRVQIGVRMDTGGNRYFLPDRLSIHSSSFVIW